ncbi:MAG: orotate phosphoribosyltransferase [Kiritimatiellaeota bacterium]|nr:orotate phosphoribosyltransferase [Kiritimatiellota bacterium]
MTTSDILKILGDTGALLSGHFELRSGLHSDRFFQCANLLRYPRHAAALCGELVRRAQADAAMGRVDGVIAPALGGLFVGYEIARALDAPSIFAEKQDGKLVLRRFAVKPGERYIVAEDVVTRGGRVQETIDILHANGAEVAAVLLLVDRSNGATQFPYPTHSLLQLAPEVWEPADCPLCKAGSKAVHPGS